MQTIDMISSIIESINSINDMMLGISNDMQKQLSVNREVNTGAQSVRTMANEIKKCN